MMHAKDNIAIVMAPSLAVGSEFTVGGKMVCAKDELPFAHKVAIKAIPKGGQIVKYGEPVGIATADIAPGGLAEKLLEAGNKALANDAWAGTLTFSNAQRGLFSAKVRLTPCGGAGEGRVVRVALLNIPENRKSAACPPSEEV